MDLLDWANRLAEKQSFDLDLEERSTILDKTDTTLRVRVYGEDPSDGLSLTYTITDEGDVIRAESVLESLDETTVRRYRTFPDSPVNGLQRVNEEDERIIHDQAEWSSQSRPSP